MTTYTRSELETRFNEYLDETGGTFGWGIYMWDASAILRKMKPEAWAQEFENWMDDQDIVYLPAPQDSPDVELFAYQSEIEAESEFSAMAMAEEYDEYQADQQVDDWQSESYGDW
jgi:hypothetical protein